MGILNEEQPDKSEKYIISAAVKKVILPGQISGSFQELTESIKQYSGNIQFVKPDMI